MPRVRELETMELSCLATERVGSGSDNVPLDPESRYVLDCGYVVASSLGLH